MADFGNVVAKGVPQLIDHHCHLQTIVGACSTIIDTHRQESLVLAVSVGVHRDPAVIYLVAVEVFVPRVVVFYQDLHIPLAS